MDLNGATRVGKSRESGSQYTIQKAEEVKRGSKRRG